MTDRPPWHDAPPPQRKPMWPGFLLGLFVVAPATAFLSIIGPGVGLLAVAVLVAAVVLLFLPDPFLRGLGAGVLTALALAVIVLFAVCYSYLQDAH